MARRISSKMLYVYVSKINKPKEDINAFILHAFPGSGKTLASLLIGAYLKEQGFIEKLLLLFQVIS